MLQSNWAYQIVERYDDIVVRDGFDPWMPMLLNDIKSLWLEAGSEVPLTFISRGGKLLDYWEPNFQKTLATDVPIVVAAKNLRENHGVTERLQIMEGITDKSEHLLVMLVERNSVQTWKWLVLNGPTGRKLGKLEVETHSPIQKQLHRPSLNPWAEPEDLADYYRIKPEYRRGFLDRCENAYKALLQELRK